MIPYLFLKFPLSLRFQILVRINSYKGKNVPIIKR